MEARKKHESDRAPAWLVKLTGRGLESALYRQLIRSPGSALNRLLIHREVPTDDFEWIDLVAECLTHDLPVILAALLDALPRTFSATRIDLDFYQQVHKVLHQEPLSLLCKAFVTNPLSKVRCISFTCMVVDPRCMATIASAIGRTRTLTEIEFRQCNLTGVHAELIARGLERSRPHAQCTLTKLRLPFNDIGRRGVVALCAAGSKLSLLDLRGNPLDAIECALIGTLLADRVSCLRVLDLSHRPNLDSKMLRALLPEPGQRSPLQELRLADCGIDELSGELLARRIRRLPELTRLDLARNPLRSSVAMIARELRQHVKSTHLNLDDVGMDLCSFADTVDSLRKLGTLKSLVLSRNAGDVEVAARVARLIVANPNLCKLELARCGWEAEATRLIFDALNKNSVLTHLDLGHCDAQDIGRSVWRLRGNTSLVKLSLRGNHFRDDPWLPAVPAFEGLKTNTALAELDLGQCQFDPAATDSLYDMLATHANLRVLDISDCLRDADSFRRGMSALAKAKMSLIDLRLGHVERWGLLNLALSKVEMLAAKHPSLMLIDIDGFMAYPADEHLQARSRIVQVLQVNFQKVARSKNYLHRLLKELIETIHRSDPSGPMPTAFSDALSSILWGYIKEMYGRPKGRNMQAFRHDALMLRRVCRSMSEVIRQRERLA